MLDVTATQLATVRAVLQTRLRGREVRAFASRMLGQARQHSDLDLILNLDGMLARAQPES